MLISLVAFFVLCAMLFYFFAKTAPLEYQHQLQDVQWRPILVQGSELDRLYALDWSARRFQYRVAWFRATGQHQVAQMYEDMAYIRTLQERLEERAPAHVRAVVRVVGA